MILIVDDERDLREILAFNISRAGYPTIEASSAEEAERIIVDGRNSIELILLDVMMGGRSGFELAADLRARGVKIPIIFLTALDTEPDLLKGFSLGADDYIAKPFSVAEVIARVKAVMLRTSSDNPSTISYGDIELDVEAKTARVGGVEVLLTKTEYGLLKLLVERPSKAFTREQLLDRVWGSDVFVEPRTVDVHITRLRKKIEHSSVQITSRTGYGYTLN